MKTLLLGMLVAGCTIANAADLKNTLPNEMAIKSLSRGNGTALEGKKLQGHEVPARLMTNSQEKGGLQNSNAIRELRGGQEGNGGGVHYCPSQTPQVQLYDLYEGEQGLFDKPINVFKQATGAKDQMIENALEKLKEFNAQFAFDVREQLNYFRQNINYVNLKLREIPDANYLGTAPGCTYEQLANWDDRVNKIFISAKFANLLKQDPVSEAAFELHEAIYKTLRKVTQVKNSDKVRRLVAYLFSNDEIGMELNEIVGYHYMANAGPSQNIADVTVQWASQAADENMILLGLGDVSNADLANGKVILKFSIPKDVGPGALRLSVSPIEGSRCVLKTSDSGSAAANVFSCEVSLTFDQLKMRKLILITNGTREAYTHSLPVQSTINVSMEATKVTANGERITAAPITLQALVSNLDYNVIFRHENRKISLGTFFGIVPSMNP